MLARCEEQAGAARGLDKALEKRVARQIPSSERGPRSTRSPSERERGNHKVRSTARLQLPSPHSPTNELSADWKILGEIWVV